MGKAKPRKPPRRTQNPYSKPSQPPPSKPQSKTPNKPPPLQNPTIPFPRSSRILLIGEGDFSFAASLLLHHPHTFSSLLATTPLPRPTLLTNHPQATTNTALLTAAPNCSVLYNIDATKLGHGVGGGGKRVRKEWDRVVFNFPHVGGKSRDVNRQVRANQELLISFLRTASPLLSPTGAIIITLFEGQPYELWNIRDLARHVGLGVERSFKFQASAYPGYRHARTLGNIEGGGGWRGEEREARTFVLVRKERKEREEQVLKRNRGGGSSEESE